VSAALEVCTAPGSLPLPPSPLPLPLTPLPLFMPCFHYMTCASCKADSTQADSTQTSLLLLPGPVIHVLPAAWLKDNELPLIVDELFIEIHYQHPSMHGFHWTKPPAREEAVKMLQALRNHGFYTHAWP